MATRLNAIMEDLAAHLNSLPEVFSTAQWGGRAYKMPGPNGNRKKPKLLAHVTPAGDGKSVSISFKLPTDRAADLVETHDWISEHSFRTLGPAGWISATLRTKTQLKQLIKLLTESRTQYPFREADEPAEPAHRRDHAHDPVARRIDSVMQIAHKDGWSPVDDFDDRPANPPSRSGRSKSRAKN